MPGLGPEVMERAEGIEVLIPVDEDDIAVGPSNQRNEAIHDAPNWSPGRPGLREEFARVDEGIRRRQRERGKTADDCVDRAGVSLVSSCGQLGLDRTAGHKGGR